MQQPARTPSTYTRFRLEHIAAGVYAAISLREGAAHGNAGIVDLGDCTLLFDSLGTPKTAEELRDAAQQLTERPVTTIINSHVDHDHWLGRRAFVQRRFSPATGRAHRLSG